jgi:hypothetical protein
MNGPKATSALSPFDSQLRTLVGAARRSHSCQTRTSAALHSITSSARASSVGGTVMPRHQLRQLVAPAGYVGREFSTSCAGLPCPC